LIEVHQVSGNHKLPFNLLSLIAYALTTLLHKRLYWLTC
jgi:hypothetical protein